MRTFRLSTDQVDFLNYLIPGMLDAAESTLTPEDRENALIQGDLEHLRKLQKIFKTETPAETIPYA